MASRKSIFIDPSLEVIVVSAGGVGTTFLIEEIRKYKKVNDEGNKDRIKHLPIPPLSSNDKLKAVYLFGDPILACLSLFRRQYHHTQSVQTNRFRNRKRIVPMEMSLDEYANKGVDSILFEEHLTNWLVKPNPIPTLFMRYEVLHENIGKLADFLGLPPSFTADFPAKKPRKTDLNTVSQITLEKLQEMYVEHKAKLKDLPDVLTRDRATGSLLSLFRRSSLHRVALKDHFLGRFPLLRKMLDAVRRSNLINGAQ